MPAEVTDAPQVDPVALGDPPLMVDGDLDRPVVARGRLDEPSAQHVVDVLRTRGWPGRPRPCGPGCPVR
jgi:hypothetical protein